MPRRFASLCLVTFAGAVATFIACGDDGGETTRSDAGSTIDAKVFLDAPSGGGSGSNTMGLGQPCTPPATGSGQGDCPANYTCLALQGTSQPWCSTTCAAGAGDMCAMGYAGPGVAGCINQISFNGGAAMSFCGITCAGDGVNGCTTTTCNGTCPGQMTCSAMLMDGSGNSVGSACQ